MPQTEGISRIASVGDHGNAYSLQNGGFIEHAGGPKVPKEQVE